MNPRDILADVPPEGEPPARPTGAGRNRAPRDLAEDWVTIWQSELAALAADRENGEHLRLVLAGWFAAAASLREQAGAFSSVDPSRPPAPPRTAAAAASPDAGDAVLRAELARLERRLAELERRLDGGGSGRGGKP